MNREELKNFINEIRKNVSNKGLALYIYNFYKLESQDIIKETNYLQKCEITERIYHIINNLYEIPKCKECNINYVKFYDMSRGYTQFCSKKCLNDNEEFKEKIKNIKNNKSKEEKEEIIKKREKKCLNKFGVKNPYQNKKIKEKIKNIKINRSEDEKRKEKKTRDETNLEKYGVEFPLQNKEIQAKRKRTLLDKMYNKLLNSNRLGGLAIPLFTMGEYKGNKNENGKLIYYLFKCTKCENKFEDNTDNGRIPRCHNCFPTEQFTKPHKTISKFLNENNIDHEIEKYIKPYSVDIFTQPNKIIETYGDFWHGNPKIYKESHLIKKNLTAKDKWLKDEKRINYLKNKGNEILIIWEDEVNNDWNNVQNKVLEFINKKE